MDFHPVKWNPGETPRLTGAYAENDRLAAAELWPVPGHGPEDVAVNDAGVWTGIEDGRILLFGSDGSGPTELAQTGGRPLGVEPHPDGGVVVCDAYAGVFRVWPDGRSERVVNSYEGETFRITNNAAVADDGTIYFSVSSRRWDLDSYVNDILEQTATGRLFRLDPDGSLTVLLDGLVFANGVALSPDADFVLVAETGRYRIHRVWLDGPRQGQSEVWAENLPGFPDNLTQSNGVFWVGYPRPRDPMLDKLLTRPWATRIVARLPDSLQPKPSPHGFVAGYDQSGNLIHNLQDPSGRVAVTTAARQVGDRLYIGSLSAGHVAVLHLDT